MLARFLGLQPAEKSIEESEDSDNEEVAEPADSKEVPRIWFCHLPLELLPKNALDGVCKIVYISRNPKDNAVSFFHFHQMARFLGQQKITWDEFFPLYTAGEIYCGSWFEHVLGFHELSKNNSRVIFLKYEDMKKNLHDEVAQLANFLQVPLDEEALSRIVRHCSFKEMKNNKMVNREGVWLFNHKVSHFMRKGTVGDWKNYFTVRQSDIFDEIYDQKMKKSNLQYTFKL